MYPAVAAILLGAGVGLATSAPLVGALCSAFLVSVAVRRRDAAVVGLAVVPSALALSVPWPLPAFMAVAVLFWSGHRDGVRLWAGSRDRSRWLSALASTGVVAVICAGSAAILADLSLPPHVTVDLAEPSRAVLVGGIAVVSLVNAAGEEMLWRGALTSWLEARGLGRPIVVMTTALSFGLSHMTGIPSGVVGVVSATMFGVVMALLRLRVGLLACIAVHVAVDAALLSVLVPRAVWIP